MACYHPLTAFRSKEIGASGKRGIVFQASLGFRDLPIKLPCGQCVGCRLERSRQWAMRCVHEASLHEDNCFVTLTYNDDHLPHDRSLNYRTFQLFQYRLRKKFGPGMRFYMCGEYGDLYQRPHYHVIYFNLDFQDKKLWKVSREQKLFVSQDLNDLWGHGYATIGSVSFESAAYVSRYIMKKVTGDLAPDHYEYIDPDTGEIFQRKPEFTNMSRRPGIGSGWFAKYKSDVYPDDFVIMKGQKVRPPKFYDSLYEAEFPSDLAKIKARRKQRGKRQEHDNTPARLAVKEKIAQSRLDRYKRTVE